MDFTSFLLIDTLQSLYRLLPVNIEKFFQQFLIDRYIGSRYNKYIG